MTKRLVIIDGKSVFYRGYYAMPNLSMSDGTPTGGVYGFTALALEVVRKLSPDYVCVAWDKPKTNIRKRLEIYPDYKAGRKPAPADFYQQIPILHEVLEAFNWPLYELDDYEADDIMATLARKASARGIETCLITSDLDALQAIDERTHVYALKKGLTNIDLFDVESFKKRYGLEVEQFLDLKSLMGDSSDNIPGVPGVGEKTAVQLLQQFETLEGVYENLWQIKDSTRRKLEAGRDSAELSKKVAELWFDAPIELDLQAMDVAELNARVVGDMLTKLEFKSLFRALPDSMRAEGDSVSDSRSSSPIELSVSSEILDALNDKILVVYYDSSDVWISHERDKVIKVSLKEAMTILDGAKIVGHGIKDFLKVLMGEGIAKLPRVVHDIEQGSFLLNPLRKSRRLADLIGVEEVNDPKYAISAIWALYDEQSQAFDSMAGLSVIAHKLDFPLINLLAKMEHRGIKLDTQILVKMDLRLSQELSNIEQQIYTLVGKEFNLASPAQLADALYVELKLPTEGVKRGKTGFSTGQKELNKLRSSHPVVPLVESYRELSKLLNTYIKALPKQVADDGRVHTDFRQDVASTGRLSSVEPNLQNIPIRTEMGREIRRAFVPEKGNVFVNADYSQFELRLVAVLAGDENMISDFEAGTDIHAKTASEVYGVSLDDVTKEQRRRAKVINFGVLYGMSKHGLAEATGMSFGEAQTFIDEYFKVRPSIREYIDKTIRQAHDAGFVETILGRRRWTPDVKSNNFIVRTSAERAAANMPIQGTEADLMKMAMLEVDGELDKFNKRNNLVEADRMACQLLQIHDSILIECRKDDSEEVGQILKSIMENIYPKLGVRLQVDIEVGDNWGDI